uniref:uncharacterized protein LOC100184049 isoform X2 n=1 Tax=Ciona intestinalis TaxID=7719 RepID=UPI00089DD0D3|nr:uncharacterized protein LOC100184049 isoform X2 [Ciona intestinalis]|eukprot:XP_018667324.1 uncharacterized protein LOC100184049 isoform X2 [Ciona intestinalis]
MDDNYDERIQNLRKRVVSNALTNQEKKQFSNYFLHLKDNNIGKRTGKPIKITDDVYNLFVSSPASSEYDEPRETTDSGISGTGMEVEVAEKSSVVNDIVPQASFVSENSTPGIESFAPPPTELCTTVIEPMSQFQLTKDGTQDGSFTSIPSSQTVNETELNKAKINKRLTFSERMKWTRTPVPNQPTKNVTSASIHGLFEDNSKRNKSSTINNIPQTNMDVSDDGSYNSFDSQFVVEDLTETSRLSKKATKQKTTSPAKRPSTVKKKISQRKSLKTSTKDANKTSSGDKQVFRSKLQSPKKHTRVTEIPLQRETSLNIANEEHDMIPNSNVEQQPSDNTKVNDQTQKKKRRNTARKSINNSKVNKVNRMDTTKHKQSLEKSNQVSDEIPGVNTSPIINHAVQSATNLPENDSDLDLDRTPTPEEPVTYTEHLTVLPDKNISVLPEQNSLKKVSKSNRTAKKSIGKRRKRFSNLNDVENEVGNTEGVSPSKLRRISTKKVQNKTQTSNASQLKEWLNTESGGVEENNVHLPSKPTKTKRKQGRPPKKKKNENLETVGAETVPLAPEQRISSDLVQSDLTEDVTETIHHAVFPHVDQSSIMNPNDMINIGKAMMGPPASTPRRAKKHRNIIPPEPSPPEADEIDIENEESSVSNFDDDSYSERVDPISVELTNNSNQRDKSNEKTKSPEKKKSIRSSSRNRHTGGEDDTDDTITHSPVKQKRKYQKKKQNRSNHQETEADKTVESPRKTNVKQKVKKAKSGSKNTSSQNKENKPKPRGEKKNRGKYNKSHNKTQNLFNPYPVELIVPDIVSVADEGLRRSKRVRTRPLDPWEHIVYGDNNEPISVEIEDSVKANMVKIWKNASILAPAVIPAKLTKQKPLKKNKTTAKAKRGRPKLQDQNVPLISSHRMENNEVSEPEDLQTLKKRNKSHVLSYLSESENENIASVDNYDDVVEQAEHTTEHERQIEPEIPQQNTKVDHVSETSHKKIPSKRGRKKKTIEPQIEPELPEQNARVNETGETSHRKSKRVKKNKNKNIDNESKLTSQPNNTYNSTNQLQTTTTSALDINNSSIDIVVKKKIVTLGTKEFFHLPENEIYFNGNGEPWQDNDPIKHSKGISNQGFSMGSMVIMPGERKELSRMKLNTLSCVVLSGTIEVAFGGREVVVTRGAYFYIPPKNEYSITNVSPVEEAVLHYSLYKNCHPLGQLDDSVATNQ